MAVFIHPITPRFRDTDLLGHVNNAVYLTYMETTRTAFYRSLELFNTNFFIVHVELDYVKSVLMDTKLRIKLWINRMGTTSLEFGYDMVDENGTVFTRAKSVHVHYNHDKQQKLVIPDKLKELLSQYQNDE